MLCWWRLTTLSLKKVRKQSLTLLLEIWYLVLQALCPKQVTSEGKRLIFILTPSVFFWVHNLCMVQWQ